MVKPECFNECMCTLVADGQHKNVTDRQTEDGKVISVCKLANVDTEYRTYKFIDNMNVFTCRQAQNFKGYHITTIFICRMTEVKHDME